MQILNLTPDSFSDGGVFTNFSRLKEKVYQCQKKGIKIFDLGAQSTAPMNRPISAEDEWSRFLKYFITPIEAGSESLFRTDTIISIDTYYPEVMAKVASYFSGQRLWWNDVSGRLDEKIFETLEIHSNIEAYIYCYSNIPDRCSVLKHMSYVQEDLLGLELVELMLQKLGEVKELFDQKSGQTQFIFDPALGFSKTADQNWYLLDNFSVWAPSIRRLFAQIPLLLGYSRKSFLRQKVQSESLRNKDKDWINHQTDGLGLQLAHRISQDCLREDLPLPILRCHNTEQYLDFYQA